MEHLLYFRTIINALYILLNFHDDSEKEMLISPGIVEEAEG